MHLETAVIRNYRRLVDVRVDFEAETTIFVGANNSGKTSATHLFRAFLKEGGKFSLYDFSSSTWAALDRCATDDLGEDAFPAIELDMWFGVEAGDLHRVLPLLPGLDWEGAPVGIRFRYAPKDVPGLIERYKSLVVEPAEGAAAAHPWPRSLSDYLRRQLSKEYETKIYGLDRSDFEDNFAERGDAKSIAIADGRKFVDELIRFDSMDAQRHLSDSDDASSLSRRLSNFYKRNLEQMDTDEQAHQALALSEQALNQHFDEVFKDTLDQLSTIGYPGVDEPKLVVRSEMDTAVLFNDRATVHYTLQNEGGETGVASTLTLPDRYNGLGYKNLIYMVVELLDYELRWKRTEGLRPLVHIVAIEEPEAHLHAQLQQVFITQLRKLLNVDHGFVCQTLVTTHSSHILYHGDFSAVRYFRRIRSGATRRNATEVLNLTDFQASTDTLEFIRQYMKLTHCDLFFSDAAVLVEGNVERLLLPMLIREHAPELQSAYLSVLELGGAFAHMFKGLIEFLGVPALVITDLDSVHGPTEADTDNGEAEPDEDDEDDTSDEASEEEARPGTTCGAWVENAVTSNRTLRDWVPSLTSVEELLAANAEACTVEPADPDRQGRVRVVYQRPITVSWRGENSERTGRTLEEEFALTNLEWVQDRARKALGLRVRGAASKDLGELAEAIHRKVSSKNFDKTAFVLSLFVHEDGWDPPAYIVDGLTWLRSQVVPGLVEAGVLDGEGQA